MAFPGIERFKSGGFVRNLLEGKYRDVGMPGAPPGPGGDLSAGISALQKDNGISEEDILNDPIYQLQLQRADLLGGGGGGGGGDISGALKAAAARYGYGGPSIEQLQQYGREGQSRISTLYGELDKYLQGAKTESQGIYNAGAMRSGAAYENAARDIAAAQEKSKAALAAQAPAGSAGAAAGQEAQAAAAASIQRQAALNESSKANALSNFSTLGAGHQVIASDLMAGMQKEKGAQSGKLSDQVSGLISRAQAEMAAAAQRTAAAQDEIRAKAQEAKAAASNKVGAAKIKALEDAISRAQKGQGKEDTLSGMKGVLAYAMKAGKPQLANKFLDMYNQSKVTAAQINNRIASDPSFAATNKKTSAEEQLQMMLGNVGGVRQDISQDINPRGDILNQLRNIPELRKYIVSNPETAKRLGEYFTAFGVNRGEYEKAGKGGSPLSDLMSRAPGLKSTPGWLQGAIKTGAGGLGNFVGKGSNIDELNQRFQPFVNLAGLRRDPTALSKYYGTFDTGEQDFMMNLYNIFGGKYGKGSY